MSIRRALAAIGTLAILAIIGFIVIEVWQGKATCSVYGSDEQLVECIVTHYPICSDAQVLSDFLHFKGFERTPSTTEPDSLIYRRPGFIKDAIVIVESKNGAISQIRGPRFSSDECITGTH